jgi:hypothetical protein
MFSIARNVQHFVGVRWRLLLALGFDGSVLPLFALEGTCPGSADGVKALERNARTKSGDVSVPWGAQFLSRSGVRVFRNPSNGCLRWSDGSGGSIERCDRVFRLVEYLKYGYELCNPYHLICMSSQVGELDVAAEPPGRNVQGH